MIRAALLVAALVAAPAHAQAARDWTAVAAAAPQGSFAIGNPRARIRLIEYVSYTCPHCREFVEASAPTLRNRWVRSGQVTIEYRNAVHDKLDLAAAALARCAGPAAFPRFHEALYARQAAWVQRGFDFLGANGNRLQMYDDLGQLRAIADGAGLSDLARASGMTPAAIAGCFANSSQVTRALQVSAATTAKSPYTPAFELNGRVIDKVTWTQLEPMLRAAGAK